MILIVTRFENDVTVYRLAEALRAQGEEPIILSLTTMESLASLWIGNTSAGGKSILRIGDQEIDLSTVTSAFLWRIWNPPARLEPYSALASNNDEWSFFTREWVTFHRGFTLMLAYNGVFCVNPPPFNSAFEEKSCQMLLAAQVGLTIPPTLYTTRLSIARTFYDTHGGDIIYKPFRSYVQIRDTEHEDKVRQAVLYTSRVKADDLVEPENFLPTPSIFQPYIEKAFEIRIVVIGRQLFACAIHSQQSERTREDWRRYDLDNTPHEPYELPAEVANKLLVLVERMGLVFGSIDMIVTPAGEHIFLEINPTGQFDWVAQLANLPLYEALATLLRTRNINYHTLALNEVSAYD